MAKVESGKVTGQEVKANRDATKQERLLQVELTDPNDIQTAELMSQTGEESNPPVGSKVTVISVGEAWKLAIASSDKIVPLVAPGEKRVYSTDVAGSTVKAQVHCKNDGTIFVSNGTGSLTLSPSGELTIVAPGDTTNTTPVHTTVGQLVGTQGLQINGSTPGGNGAEIISNLLAGGDVVGAMISLANHTHTDVQSGTGVSGPPSGGGGGPNPNFIWGNIGGTLSNQADLQAELDAKWGVPANAAVLLLTEEPYTTAEKNKLAGINPGDTVVTEKTAGQGHSAGTSDEYSRADHTHGTPPGGSGGGITGTFIGVNGEVDSLAQFELCYLNADGKRYRVNALDVGTCTGDIAFATEIIETGETGTFQVLGDIATSGLTTGKFYYIDELNGGITDDLSTFEVGSIVRTVGYALSAALFRISISPDYFAVGAANSFARTMNIAIIGQSNGIKFHDTQSAIYPTRAGVDTAQARTDYGIQQKKQATGQGRIIVGQIVQENLYVDVAFVYYAVGGTALLEKADGITVGWWNDTTTPSTDGALSLYTRFIEGVEKFGQDLDYVLFIQGEQDARAGRDGYAGVAVSEAEYQTGLELLISNIRNDLGNASLPFIIVPTGRIVLGGLTSDTDDGFDNIRAAQLTVGAQANNYTPGNVLDGDLFDWIHWHHASPSTTVNTVALIAQRIAKAILYDQGSVTEYRSPVVASWSYVNSTTITIALTHYSGTDFTPTSGIAGFTVEGAAVTGVRTDATTITLTGSGFTDTDMDVRYGSGASPFANTEVITSRGVHDNSDTLGQTNTLRGMPLQPNVSIMKL
jgi:hypothetical protein